MKRPRGPARYRCVTPEGFLNNSRSVDGVIEGPPNFRIMKHWPPGIEHDAIDIVAEKGIETHRRLGLQKLTRLWSDLVEKIHFAAHRAGPCGANGRVKPPDESVDFGGPAIVPRK